MMRSSADLQSCVTPSPLCRRICPAPDPSAHPTLAESAAKSMASLCVRCQQRQWRTSPARTRWLRSRFQCQPMETTPHRCAYFHQLTLMLAGGHIKTSMASIDFGILVYL